MRRGNSFVVKGKFVYVFLTQGKKTIIDREDLERALEHQWCTIKNHNTFYAVTHIRLRVNVWRPLQLHRFLTGNVRTDHRDRDGLNNRRRNLREATSQVNGQNRRIQCNNKTGYQGVCYVTHQRISGKFKAGIKINGRSQHLGYYNTVEEAALAYDRAAVKLFGLGARLNF
jgi:hypothetical protein